MNRRRMVVCPRRSVVRVSRATAVSVNGRRSITVERAPARSHSRSAQPDRPATARRPRSAAQSHQSQRAAPPAASQSVDRHLPDTARADHQLTALVWIATMILGTLIAGKGIRMIIWRDRRRAARRGTGNTKPSSVWPASDAAVKHRPWSWIGRVSTGKASKHSRPEVTPPELE